MAKTQFNPQVLDDVKTVIANLIDNPGGIKEMGNKKLEPGFVKQILPFEDTVLRIIYYCHNNNLPSTKNDIIHHLLAGGEFEHDDIEAKMNGLMLYQTVPPLVKPSAYTIANFIETQGLRTVLEKWQRNLDSYFYVDVWQGLFADLKNIAPGNNRFETITDMELKGQFSLEMARRAEIARKGETPGPYLPWADTRKAIPYARKGQMNTFVLVSGGGKTGMSCQIAFDIAYTQGYDVLFFHLETEAIEMQERHMNREMHIPTYVFDYGAYTRPNQERKFTDDSNEEWVATQKEYDNFVDNAEGSITYVHAPGISVDEMEVQIEDFKIEAEKRGREVVVIVDYYQLMSHPDFKGSDNETPKNNKNAELLKDMFDTQQVFAFVMAQDATHPDYLSPNKQDTADEVRPYEGYRIVQRSQVLFQIRRKRPSGDLTRLSGDGVLTDWIGNDMYWHRSRDKWDSEVDWFPAKVNKGSTARFKTRMCNAYFDMGDYE